MRQLQPKLLEEPAPPVEIPDPRHHWPIEQGSGNILYDLASSGAIHCQFGDNNQVWASGLVAGSNFAVKTTGGKGAANTGGATLSGLGDRTISFWYRPGDIGASKILLNTQNLGSPQNGAFYVMHQAGVFLIATRSAGANRSLSSNAQGNSSTPRFYVFSQELGVSGFVHINGVDQTASDTTPLVSATDPGLWVNLCGENLYGGYSIVNEVDDLKVWDQALTPEEAVALYQSYS